MPAPVSVADSTWRGVPAPSCLLSGLQRVVARMLPREPGGERDGLPERRPRVMRNPECLDGDLALRGHFRAPVGIGFDIRQRNVLTADPEHPFFNVQTGEVRSRGIELEGLRASGSNWT
ncbi:hypothetical protein [Burkholderia contaminans]|uniref:hypothetical protein n=1 Tax=Burkholderia contaminans TaxID=488447 RepID=UPI001CF3D407|nr:hypothetical protein [Burkholderia contaminans]MCA8100153.1 hypothetical protein [Burkholderia contaminans]